MDSYSLHRRNSISQIKIICFQIKEDLLNCLNEIQKFRQHIYSHFSQKSKDIEFGSFSEDVEFLIEQRRKISNKANLHPQDNHFFEVQLCKLRKYQLQFTDKNEVIVLFLQQAKNSVNNSHSLNKKLIENMDFIRLYLFKYYNSFQDD